jgi:twin BRCT domain
VKSYQPHRRTIHLNMSLHELSRRGNTRYPGLTHKWSLLFPTLSSKRASSSQMKRCCKVFPCNLGIGKNLDTALQVAANLAVKLGASCNMQVVTPEWLQACSDAKALVGDSPQGPNPKTLLNLPLPPCRRAAVPRSLAYRPSAREHRRASDGATPQVPTATYRLPPFKGLKVAMTGLDPNTKKALGAQVAAGGGTYTVDLTKDCTHLIALPGQANSDKCRWGSSLASTSNATHETCCEHSSAAMPRIVQERQIDVAILLRSLGAGLE